ncbi:MAG: DUF6328 family protein [Betaproteobacteria bacterium]
MSQREMEMRAEEREALSLKDAAGHLLEECRMVLPGIQALFGFQLIVVFSPGFDDKLGPPEQYLHLLAIALVIVAVILVMSPAAWHRQLGPREVTAGFIRISTRLLLASMFPLALGICLDFFLVAKIIIDDGRLPALMALVLAGIFGMVWFLFPRMGRLRDFLGRE